MIYKTIKVFSYFTLSFSILACYPESNFNGRIEGYRPVYSTETAAVIKFEEARAIHTPGKIYTYGSYLLINERKLGIHIYDNSDPSSPIALGFLHIPGNVDMAVRNNILFVDHFSSLLSLDITDLHNIKELSRIKTWKDNLPPSGYFECVDPTKGEVIGWDLVTLENPACRR
jgi:hypothetical protein